jgi:hypothetical protein
MIRGMAQSAQKYIYYNIQYKNIYDMNYIFNNEKIINNNTIININNMNTHILNYKEVIQLLKKHFSPTSMIKYFGGMRDLNGKETRTLYKYLLETYMGLFMTKMKEKTGIDVLTISDDEDSYLCFIAECMNIIRASIKKYVRLRTSASQWWLCQREYLEKRNSEEYGCPTPVKEYEYCPSFSILKSRGKTCRKILESSMRTNNLYSLMSDLCILPKGRPLPINKNKNIFPSTPTPRRMTRKKKKNIA